MNAKERDLVACFICIADEYDVPIANIIKDLSACDKKFRAVYDEWSTIHEKESKKLIEFKRQMHAEFGSEWALTKGASERAKEIMAEIEENWDNE